MNDLPGEMYEEIFSYLNNVDLCILKMTCKKFKRILPEISTSPGYIANMGYLRLLKKIKLDNDVCEGAASGGHLDCLIYGYNMGIPLKKSIYYSMESNLDCVKWLMKNGERMSKIYGKFWLPECKHFFFNFYTDNLRT